VSAIGRLVPVKTVSHRHLTDCLQAQSSHAGEI
jgi:hypothetical protein